MLFSFSMVLGGTITSTGTGGNWNATATWAGSVVPVAGDDVIIANGTTVTISAAVATALNSLTINNGGILNVTTNSFTATVGTLTVGQGTSGSLIFNGTAARTMIAGNVTIAAGGIIQSTGSNAISNTLTINGDFTNNGTFNGAGTGTNKLNITFSNASSNAFTSSATAVNTFNNITLTKTANTNVLDFNPSSAVTFPAAGFLTLTTGTLKLSGTQTISNSFFTAAYTIPAAAGFWLNNPNVTVTALNGSATIAGLLRVSTGTYNAGTVTGNTFTGSANGNVTVDGGTLNIAGTYTNTGYFTLSSGTVNVGIASTNNFASNGVTASSAFNISGGNLNIAGKYTMSSTAVYTQSAGTVTVGLFANTAAAAGMFTTVAANNFVVSGGTIVLQNNNTFATSPIDYNVASTTLNITGGILQVGNASTPASATFKIQGSTPSLVLNNSSGNNPGTTISAALTVLGDITLNGSGTFTKGAFPLTITGNSGAPGNLTVSGTNTLTLNGSATLANALTFNSSFGNQTLSLGSGTITSNELPSLTIANTFASGTVTIPSGLSLMAASTLTLTSGSCNAGTGGAGTIGFGTTTAGTFTCVRTTGSLVAATSSFGSGVTTRTYTYNGAATQTTDMEIPASAIIDVLTINNSSLILNLDEALTVNTTLNLTNGIVNTTSTNILMLGSGAAAGTLTGGSATAFINGPFARSFAVRASSATYNATTLWPIGKGSAYLPLYMAPTNTVAGLILKAEAFTTNSGTNISPSGSLSSTRWEAFATSGGTNMTNVFIRETDATIAATNVILKSASAAGVYSPVSVTSTAVAGATLTTATAIPNAEFTGSGYFSFGNGCTAPAVLTGPINVCTGAVSQWVSSLAGTWASSATGIATIDVSGNITGAAPGTSTITFTVSSAGFCTGLSTTRIVSINNCSTAPGNVSNNLVSWYKGDAGLSTGTWTDQTSSNNLTASGTPTVSNTINFNPAATLNGTTDYYGNTNADGWLGTTNATTYYYVALGNAVAASNRVVYGRGTANGATTSMHAGRRNTGDGIFASGNIANGITPISATYTWSTTAAVTVLSRNGYDGTDYYMNVNGSTESSTTVSGLTIAGATPFYIGRAATSGNFWSGRVAEVIAFNGKQTGSDYNKIESYLALKYGITLDQTTARDYIASDGTTKMWDAASAGIYTTNIFGIGKDNGSGLDQRISTSANSTSILTLSTDNDFAGLNTTHTDIFTDKQFITIADNGLAMAWTNAGNISGYARLRKTWKITNSPALTVHVQFNVENSSNNVPDYLFGSAYYLVTDPNADGDYSDGTTVALTNTSGSLWSGSLTLTNGGVFTLATAVPPIEGKPGGVSSAIWLKANAGIPVADGAAISTWVDMSGVRINNATNANEPSSPVYAKSGSGLINYNPSVLFDGINNGLNFGDDYVSSPSANGGVHLFAAVKPKVPASSKNYGFIMDIGGFAGSGYGFGYSTTASFGYTPSNLNLLANPATTTDPAVVEFDVTYGITQTFNNNSLVIGSVPTGAAGLVPNVNFSTTSTHVGPFGPFTIGKMSKTDAYAADGIRSYAGYIGEVVHFNRNITVTEEQQVRSYLALKYGTTLSNNVTGRGDYLLSDATVAWDGETTPEYQQNIIGIIRDDSSGIVQKQSHAINDSLRIFISNLAVTNADNTGTITNNKSSVIIGHNSGILQGNFDTRPAGIYNRLGRSWKITNTNFTDAYSVEIEWDSVGTFDLNDIRLLVSTSPDFSAATVYNTPDVTFSLGSIIVSGISTSIIPVNSTRYITIASASVTTTLPVQWQAFTATPVNNSSVNLAWQTGSETNNDYFSVQRSSNGVSWIDVTTIKGAGTSITFKTYDAVDNNPYTGKSYYRIKQTDIDGASRYSPVRTVTIAVNALRIFPNPASSGITVEGPATEISRIKIYNRVGQDVTGLTRLISSGGSRVVIDLSLLNNGIYVIQTNNSRHKIFKQ
ncbi:MAG: T9SS type A sorting domain-containing protein [Agriterribacter sp.]